MAVLFGPVDEDRIGVALVASLRVLGSRYRCTEAPPEAVAQTSRKRALYGVLRQADDERHGPLSVPSPQSNTALPFCAVDG